MRKSNLNRFEYGNSIGYQKFKQNQNNMINILTEVQKSEEIKKDIGQMGSKANNDKFVKDSTSTMSKDSKKNIDKNKAEKVVKENVTKSLKHFMVATTFNALNLDKTFLRENRKNIISTLNEFYESAFKCDLLTLEKFEKNPFELTRNVYNLIQENENRQVHIHIYNDKTIQTPTANPNGEAPAMPSPPEEQSDEEMNAEHEDLEDDLGDHGLDEIDGEGSDEDSGESEEDSDEDLGDMGDLDDLGDLDEDEDSKESKPAKKSEEKPKSEKKEPKSKSENKKEKKAEKISKEASDTVKNKVSDVLNSEKEASKKIKETEKSMKESNIPFLAKTETTLFKSIMLNAQNRFMKTAGNLYTEQNSKFMELVLGESIIVYTLLETLNTLGFIPTDAEYVKYISRHLQKI